MKLIKCPDCKQDVSKKASHCPNCGSPVKIKRRMKKSQGISAIIFFIMILAGVDLAWDGNWYGYFLVIAGVVLLIAKFKLWNLLNIRVK